MLPFDLHVLGLPPAFVLSQDQTLQEENIDWQSSHQISLTRVASACSVCVPMQDLELTARLAVLLGLAIQFSENEPTSSSTSEPLILSCFAIRFTYLHLVSPAFNFFFQPVLILFSFRRRSDFSEGLAEGGSFYIQRLKFVKALYFAFFFALRPIYRLRALIRLISYSTLVRDGDSLRNLTSSRRTTPACPNYPPVSPPRRRRPSRGRAVYTPLVPTVNTPTAFF